MFKSTLQFNRGIFMLRIRRFFQLVGTIQHCGHADHFGFCRIGLLTAWELSRFMVGDRMYKAPKGCVSKMPRGVT